MFQRHLFVGADRWKEVFTNKIKLQMIRIAIKFMKAKNTLCVYKTAQHCALSKRTGVFQPVSGEGALMAFAHLSTQYMKVCKWGSLKMKENGIQLSFAATKFRRSENIPKVGLWAKLIHVSFLFTFTLKWHGFMCQQHINENQLTYFKNI